MAQAEALGTRRLAFGAVPDLDTHSLFAFVQGAARARGWGYSLRRAVATWYTRRAATHLALATAYVPEGSGYTHADLLRLAHPKPPSYDHAWLFARILGKEPAIAGVISEDLREALAYLDRQRSTHPTDRADSPAGTERS